MQIPASAAEKVLASFAADDAVKAWNSVNDGVMGGVSKGGASRTEQGTLLFSGELSLANNGGFASIRTEPRSLGLADSSAIVVKARGDGRTYSIELRVAGQMGASSYRAYLPTSAGQWQETRISLKDFKPQAFGRALPFKAVNPANVDSIGFTLADKKAGPFKLEIESVNATDDQRPPRRPSRPPRRKETRWWSRHRRWQLQDLAGRRHRRRSGRRAPGEGPSPCSRPPTRRSPNCQPGPSRRFETREPGHPRGDPEKPRARRQGNPGQGPGGR